MKNLLLFFCCIPIILGAQRSPATPGGGGGGGGGTTYGLQVVDGTLSLIPGGGAPSVYIGEGAAAATNITEAYLNSLDSTVFTVLKIRQMVGITGTVRLGGRIHAEFETGGGINFLSDNANISFKNAINAPRTRIFYGQEGHVTIEAAEAAGEWWGMKPNGSVDWMGYTGIAADTTPNFHYMRKACYAVLPYPNPQVSVGDGVFIMRDAVTSVRHRFGRGKQVQENSAAVQFFDNFTNSDAYVYDHLTIKLSDGAYLLPDSQDKSAVNYSPYRSTGWLDGPSDFARVATYSDTVVVGARAVRTKSAAMAARFQAGDRIFIRQGASTWDPDKGESNIVRYVEDEWLHLEYPIASDFTPETVSYVGTIGAFTQPAEGATVTVDYTVVMCGGSDCTKPLGGVDAAVTIGNNVYEVVSGSGGTGTYTIRSAVGLGNDPAGTEFPAGQKAMKTRIIFPMTTSTFGAGLVGGNVFGGHDGWRLSNYIACYAKDVNVYHAGSNQGGLTIDGDGGRNFYMERCTTKVRPGQFEGGQWVRSTTGWRSKDCRWVGVKHSIAEFANDMIFDHDLFEMDARHDEKIDSVSPGVFNETTSAFAILLGRSIGEVGFINGTRFVVSGGRDDGVIGSAGLLYFSASVGNHFYLRDVEMKVDGVGSLVSLKGTGIEISGLVGTGSVYKLFGALGSAVSDSNDVTGIFDKGIDVYTTNAVTTVDNFHFAGRFNQVLGADVYAIKINPNSSATWTGGVEGDGPDHTEVLNGILADKAGPSAGYITSTIQTEMTLYGFPTVSGINGNKTRAIMSARDYMIFHMVDSPVYTQSGTTYNFTGNYVSQDNVKTQTFTGIR